MQLGSMGFSRHTLELKGSFTNFCDVILYLIEDSEPGLACISMVFLRIQSPSLP